ncbi:TSCPD domain-containing protein [Odoribacter laneus]|jgi:uncharacterized protein TIGR03905|uniref:ribonucleoside-diphosphate reductase n=1 Tax=Odoribacter laneus YIT 12061 TaxID=742817 RepID=H1DET6_9BACT|nr:TIGR03905 family TSCPD domain-containing protein [Odoribacter laneus]EHP49578.1 hypothetical protein HMPREF9449_00772 [Odoribacter laneus YIT 12061]GKI22221.1 TSCPD domain-containing protein [Odoribacter laneus]GKI24664.1 TSCPD domain-containing protein [Odoribacter laneus]CCZ80218.1 putative uncharacterized protein [Odoribacter laneus CAG:561]
MEKSIHYIPAGVCSQTIDITVEDGIVKEVYFEGGCHGNLQGISLLVKGMKIGEVINRLEGIHCGYKNTSCPDQFAKALRILEQK